MEVGEDRELKEKGETQETRKWEDASKLPQVFHLCWSFPLWWILNHLSHCFPNLCQLFKSLQIVVIKLHTIKSTEAWRRIIKVGFCFHYEGWAKALPGCELTPDPTSEGHQSRSQHVDGHTGNHSVNSPKPNPCQDSTDVLKILRVICKLKWSPANS